MYHQATSKFINFCVENEVSEIIMGDIKGIEKNTKKNKRLHRKNRQKISQMEYGRVKDYIKYKGQVKGIKVKLVKEDYTSQTCPKCLQRHKPQGRRYDCTCGYKAHRDIVGAWNILNKEKEYPLVRFNIRYRQPIRKVSTERQIA